MTKHAIAMVAVWGLAGCRSTPQITESEPPPKQVIISDDRRDTGALLDAEFRRLIEVQDSFRMMLMLTDSTGDRRFVWTDEQFERGNQLSVGIVRLISRYTWDRTAGANLPNSIDPALFGQEVDRIAEQRAALWLDLVESNDLPDSARSIFHNKLTPARE